MIKEICKMLMVCVMVKKRVGDLESPALLNSKQTHYEQKPIILRTSPL